jgi:hypothetical protein
LIVFAENAGKILKISENEPKKYQFAKDSCAFAPNADIYIQKDFVSIAINQTA